MWEDLYGFGAFWWESVLMGGAFWWQDPESMWFPFWWEDQESMWFRLFLLCLIDALGMNRLWGERVHRRCLHHIEKNVWNPSRQPFIKKLRKFLPVRKHLPALADLDLGYGDKAAGGGNQWPLICKLSVAQYSPRATIYYDAMNAETRKLVDQIGCDVAKYLSANCLTERIQLAPKTSSFRACILRYEGTAAEFPWHYDTEHPSCYRALFLFQKEGNISPLQYYDASGQVKTYHCEVGDGWIFKGTSTLHRVPRNDDPKSKRYMLGFQFVPAPAAAPPSIPPKSATSTSEDENVIVQQELEHVSICSMLRQARPLKILHEFAPCFFVCWLAVLFGHTSTVKQSFKDLLLNDTWVIGRWWLLVSSFVTIALSMFLPGVLAQYISVRPEEGGGDAVSLVSNASSGAGGSSSCPSTCCPSEDELDSEVEQELELVALEELGAEQQCSPNHVAMSTTTKTTSSTSSLVVEPEEHNSSPAQSAPPFAAASLTAAGLRHRTTVSVADRTTAGAAATANANQRPQDEIGTSSTPTATASAIKSTARTPTATETADEPAQSHPFLPPASITVQTSTAVASSSPASPSTPLSGSKSKFICGVKFLLAKTTGLPEKRYCGDHKPWIGTGMNKSLGTLLRLYLGCVLTAVDLQTGFYYMAYLLATEMLLPNSMVGYE
mmetsp:Transcript_19633/g.49353  ORF Transcript_19633/g.49353 Transcript_19633/m.49353 type:complete len:666 (-) Transcript_19633:737-2734(-)